MKAYKKQIEAADKMKAWLKNNPGKTEEDYKQF